MNELGNNHQQTISFNSNETLKTKKLTPRQQRFVDVYAGDIKEAAKEAEISYAYARELMTKSHVVETIRRREARDSESTPG